MTDEQLNEIEARANAATEGPWVVGISVDSYGWPVLRLRDLAGATRHDRLREQERNADFIAAARADVPALIAEVRQLRAATPPSPLAPPPA